MNVPPAELHAKITEELLEHHRFGDWNAKLGIEQGFHCIYCDRDFLASFDDYDSWQWDHVYPLSLDGDDTLENIVVCCKACNFLKRAYAPTGTTKAERIADARRYVQELRALRESEVVAIRQLVRSSDAQPNTRHA
jgi:5-methylcytosine-specific restriction endonuclease McrA